MKDKKIYALETVNILRKYLFPLNFVYLICSDLGSVLINSLLKREISNKDFVYFNWNVH